MTSMAMRLACILHCRLCLESIKQSCERHSNVVLVYAGDRNGITIADLAALRLDVVLLDLESRDEAFELAQNIRRSWTSIRLAFVSSSWTDLQLAKALQIEANGLLLKSDSIDALFGHLEQINLGQMRVSEGLKPRLSYNAEVRKYFVTAGGPVTSLNTLQLEILRLLACGDSLKMVASKLHLSKKSIDGHKYRLMRKLGIKDRVLLSRLAIREGLIQP